MVQCIHFSGKTIFPPLLFVSVSKQTRPQHCLGGPLQPLPSLHPPDGGRKETFTSWGRERGESRRGGDGERKTNKFILEAAKKTVTYGDECPPGYIQGYCALYLLALAY